MDLAANASGIHVLIKRTSGNIVYYYLNSSGVINSGKTYTMEADGDFPNIIASNDRVYALYKTGSNIKGKYSTNGGTSWSNLPDRPTTANLCNGVDADYQDQLGVHLVWATRDNGYDFETYYYRLPPTTPYQWVEGKNVTDHSSAQVGGRPSVSFSSGRVHVSFSNSYYEEPYGFGLASTRDRLNGVWQTPQPFVTGTDVSVKEMLLVRGSTLFMFYSQFIDGIPAYDNLVYRTRSVSGTTWSSPTILAYAIEESGNAFNVTKTTDDNIHVVIYPEETEQSSGLVHRTYNGSSWSSAVLLDSDPSYGRNVGFTSVSNDLFLTFMRGSDNYLRNKQYDTAPLAPQNLTVSVYTVPDHSYPQLFWNLNNEPDVRTNDDGYLIERRTRIAEGSWSSWTQIAYRGGGISIFIDYGIGTAGDGFNDAEYRLRANDINNHASEYSSSVQIEYGHQGLEKKNIGTTALTAYALNQNYPNPFNPTTKISYSIKEEGLVTLKVYDILGKEIATLVNENKPAGFYEAEFNASQLPSGMYIYKIQSGSFSDVKKMLLTK